MNRCATALVPALAFAENAPGITDSEIKIGQPMAIAARRQLTAPWRRPNSPTSRWSMTREG